MYVESKSIPEPSLDGFGGFGNFGNFGAGTSGHSPFDEEERQMTMDADSGGDGTAAAIGEILGRLLPCAASPDKTGCLWDVILTAIVTQVDAQSGRMEDFLDTVMTTDCYTALTSLGADPLAAGTACAILGPSWNLVQGKARDKLVELGFLESPGADWDRGTDRTPEQGGGHTLVDASGRVTGVFCPRYSPLMDASGNVVGFSVDMAGGSTLGPTGRCPMPPTVAGSSKAGMRRQVARPTVEARTILGGGRLMGRVVDSSGSPVARAEIRVGSLRNPPAGLTGADGTFDVPAASLPNQRLYIAAAGYDGAMVEGLSVTTGSRQDVGSITLPPAGFKTEGTGGAWYTSLLLWVGGIVIVGGLGYLIYRTRKG